MEGNLVSTAYSWVYLQACRCIPNPCVILKVVDGLDIVKQVENTATGRNDAPKEAITIADAGEL